MAFDKVIDSGKLEADLTTVANAIRTKGGTSGSLEFPSGFVSAVEAISASGGSSGGASGIYMAKITPAADTSSIRVEHNLNSDVIAAFLYVDNWTIDPETVGRNFPVAHMYIKTGIDVYTSSSAYKNAYVANNTYNFTNKYVSRSGGWTSNSYTPSPIDANTFNFWTANTAASKFIAGQTLTCVIVSDIAEV